MARLSPLRALVALLLLVPLLAAVGEWHAAGAAGHAGHALDGPLPGPGDGLLTAPGRTAPDPGACPACLHQLRAGAATLPVVAALPARAVARTPEAPSLVPPVRLAARAADARGPPAAG